MYTRIYMYMLTCPCRYFCIIWNRNINCGRGKKCICIIIVCCAHTHLSNTCVQHIAYVIAGRLKRAYRDRYMNIRVHDISLRLQKKHVKHIYIHEHIYIIPEIKPMPTRTLTHTHTCTHTLPRPIHVHVCAHTYMYMYMYMSRVCCVALPCCLFDLAYFFLPSFSSHTHTCIMYTCARTHTPPRPTCTCILYTREHTATAHTCMCTHIHVYCIHVNTPPRPTCTHIHIHVYCIHVNTLPRPIHVHVCAHTYIYMYIVYM